VSAPRIVHLSIGDELLTGRHPDLDAPRVAAALAGLGLALEEVRVLPDDEAVLVPGLRELARGRDLVVTSGGLGPTLDDVTRHAIAAAWDVPLEFREDAWRGIRAWFADRGIDPPEANRRQALIPRGAQVLANHHGTAPGFWLDGGAGRAAVMALPGPPRELSGMLIDVATERIGRALARGRRSVRREVTLFGLSESVFAERAVDWMDRAAEPRMGVSAREGLLVVSVSSSAPDAEERVAERLAAFAERFRTHLVSEGDRRLDELLVERLIASGTTVTTAESCTGGRIAAALTRHAGVSDVFHQGLVTYSNEAKQRLLGVSAATLERHGAVSSETAAEMAVGAARTSGARLALAVTGVAGPGGGTPEKPVGLVWFGVARDGRVWTLERRFPRTDRVRIQRFAEQTALHLGLAALDGRLAEVGAQDVTDEAPHVTDRAPEATGEAGRAPGDARRRGSRG
jgi:nicotinamide-nucleotide amidase